MSLRNIKKKRIKNNEQHLQWETIKQTNTRILGAPEENRATKRIFEEIMAHNLSNLIKAINLNSQEAKQTLTRIMSKKTNTEHIIKLSKAKTKRKILKAARESTYHKQRILNRLTDSFSSEIMGVKRQ